MNSKMLSPKEVVDAVVVEIDSSLDQPEAEHPFAEVEIRLRLVYGGGDMMEVLDGMTHDCSP